MINCGKVLSFIVGLFFSRHFFGAMKYYFALKLIKYICQEITLSLIHPKYLGRIMGELDKYCMYSIEYVKFLFLN